MEDVSYYQLKKSTSFKSCFFLSLFLIFAFTYGALCAQRDEPANRSVNESFTDFYTYLPEETLGDTNIHLDNMRYLEGWFKGINLFRWGEIYSPLTWGFIKGKSFKSSTVYQPDNLRDMIWEYLLPDLPVRVIKKKEKVEYIWSYSLNQSEFTKSHQRGLFIPERKNYLHLQSDFKQVNFLEITKKKITLTSSMAFLNAPGKVIFYPVLFPGTGKAGRGIKELRIQGKGCTVIDKDGKSRTVIYPKEVKSNLWLNNEPRSLIFNLDDIGKIRYNFSFSDPDISLLFYAHTGWPSPFRNPYGIPAIVGKIVIPVKGKFKNGMYKCSMKTEVVLGDAVDEKPDLKPPAEVPINKYLDVGIESRTPAFRFFPDDPIVFNIVIDGIKDNEPRELSLHTTVLDYENKVIDKQELHLSFPRDIEKPLELEIPRKGRGAFILKVELRERDEVIGFRAQRFCVINKPYSYPSEKSFFGCMSLWMRAGGGERFYEACKKELSLLYDLGIKKLRWSEHYYVTWAGVEKEQGKYTFPTPSKQLILAKEAKMDCFMDGTSTFEGQRLAPEWAKSGKKTLRNYDIPNDFKAYENYCYEVSKRYKGIIDTFELENEPNYAVRNVSSEAREDYTRIRAKMLSTAYKGIKRGNPDALVAGGTLGGPYIPDLEWLEDLLEYAKGKGWKLFDIMAPHYLLRSGGTPPETRVENIIYARKIADKYNLILWNGEDGTAPDFCSIYPNASFIPEEKKYAAYSIREYLLQKSLGVEHINLCHAAGESGVGRLHWWGCSNMGFFGSGGFIKPFAVAHSALAYLLEGSVFRERIDLRFKDAWCVIFERNKETMAALWMKEGKAEWNVILPGDTEHINIVGTVKEIEGAKRFTLGDEPFYLRAKGKSGEKLVNALKKSTLIPDRLIEIEKIAFSEDKKALKVQIRNYSGIPLKLDSIKVRYGKNEIKLEKVPISSEEHTFLRLIPEKPIRNNIVAKVAAIVKDRTYEKEEFVLYPTFKSVQKMGYLIAIKARGPVKIDGDLSEWKKAVPIMLNRKDQVIYNNRFSDKIKLEDLGAWRGVEDLSAEGYLMWDEENLYFACKVTDDTYANPFSSTWNCDSIQIAIDPLMDNKRHGQNYNDDDQEINMALTKKGPVYLRRTFGRSGKRYRGKRTILPKGQIPGAELAVEKWEKGLIYEFKVPIKELYPLRIKPGTFARFNFIVNEDDGVGREMWMGITPGIGERKAPYLYRKVFPFTMKETEK